MCVNYRFYCFLNPERSRSLLDKSRFILELKKQADQLNLVLQTLNKNYLT